MRDACTAQLDRHRHRVPRWPPGANVHHGQVPGHLPWRGHDEARASITPEESSAFIARWGAWATQLGEALVDPGAPLHRRIRLTADAAEPFEDSKTGYAIVDAASHDRAVAMFATHPHLALIPGNSIEIVECPAPPA